MRRARVVCAALTTSLWRGGGTVRAGRTKRTDGALFKPRRRKRRDCTYAVRARPPIDGDRRMTGSNASLGSQRVGSLAAMWARSRHLAATCPCLVCTSAVENKLVYAGIGAARSPERMSAAVVFASRRRAFDAGRFTVRSSEQVCRRCSGDDRPCPFLAVHRALSKPVNPDIFLP